MTDLAAPGRSPVFDVFAVPVPSGLVDSPLEERHVIDMHLGQPVQLSCRMDGREWRGLQTHGAFNIVPAGVTSRWMLARPAHALILRLTTSLLASAADAMGVRARDAALVPAMHVRDPQIERIGWMMQAEHDDGYPGGRLFTDSLGAALASRLVGLQSRHAPPRRSSGALPRGRLRRVVEYVDAHLDEDLTLAELAAVAGYSLSHFKPLFKQATGLPVHRYVLERRVERARLLLLAGGRSMADIALEAGFAHQSHMARCLRRVLGLSPSQIAASSR